MKLKLSFKVHFLSSYLYYIIYISLVLLSLILKFTLNIDNDLYLTYIILSGAIFSIILGIYEYLIVLHTYLNFQPNPRMFWIHSLLANLVNALICLLLFIIINLITLSTGASFKIDEISLILIIYIFAYSLGSVGYVFLHRIKYLLPISIIILICLLIFLGSIIQEGLLNGLSYYFNHKVLCLIPLALAIIANALILARLNKFIK